MCDEEIGTEDKVYFYHSDHLGDANYITDIDGEVFEHLEYFPMGETWVHEHSNSNINLFKFTGKELDEATGLYYFGARYYDPQTSQWQSPDPILGDYLGSDPKELRNGGAYFPVNLGLYSYTYNNPVKYVDPDGNSPLKGVVTEGVEQENLMGVNYDSPYLYELRPHNRAAKTRSVIDNDLYEEGLGRGNKSQY